LPRERPATHVGRHLEVHAVVEGELIIAAGADLVEAAWADLLWANAGHKQGGSHPCAVGQCGEADLNGDSADELGDKFGGPVDFVEADVGSANEVEEGCGCPLAGFLCEE